MNKKISTFIHIIDDETIWDALNKELISLDKATIKYIKNNKDNEKLLDIPKNIVNNKYIITTVKDEQNLINHWIDKTTDKQFQGLYLITTTGCNLDCDYCFYRSSISESLHKKNNMPFEVAKEAILRFKEIVKNNKKDNNYWQQITFYGGEPSINKQLLIKAIPFAKKTFNDKYTSLVINTNLTIYDEELFNIYKDYNVEVQVSIDGDEKAHNLHRKMFNGTGSYNLVIDNIKKLNEMGVKVTPMITATDANIDRFSDILCQLVNDLKIEDFGVNILISNSYDVDDDYPQKLAKEIYDAYKKVGDKVFDYSFVELYEGILGINKEITRNSCGSNRKITVFPNGNVFSCQALEKHPKNYMGTLNEDFIKNPNWEYWRKRNKFANQKCLNCPVIGTCGGGCAQGSYNKYKTIYDVDYNQCEYAKALFNLLMKDKK